MTNQGTTEGKVKRPKRTGFFPTRGEQAERLLRLAEEFRRAHGAINARTGTLRQFSREMNQVPEFAAYVGTAENWQVRLRETTLAAEIDARPDAAEQHHWARKLKVLCTEHALTYRDMVQRTGICMTKWLNYTNNLRVIPGSVVLRAGAAVGLSGSDTAERFGMRWVGTSTEGAGTAAVRPERVTVTKPAAPEQTVLPLAAAGRAASDAQAEVNAILFDMATRRQGLSPSEVLLLASTLDPKRFSARSLIGARMEQEGANHGK